VTAVGGNSARVWPGGVDTRPEDTAAAPTVMPTPAVPAAATPTAERGGSKRRKSANPTIPPRHARQEVIAAPTADALPRRVRQTSLAPQLRGEPEPPPEAPSSTSRSPEQQRAMMSSFQAGLARGRREAVIDPTGENGIRPEGEPGDADE
jgi:hypothetical protein